MAAKIEALEPKQTELEQLTANLTARTIKNTEELAKAKSLNETFGARSSQLQQSFETVGINSNILLTSLNDADSEADSMNTNYIESELCGPSLFVHSFKANIIILFCLKT